MNINALTVTQVNTYIKAILDENVHLKNIYTVSYTHLTLPTT